MAEKKYNQGKLDYMYICCKNVKRYMKYTHNAAALYMTGKRMHQKSCMEKQKIHREWCQFRVSHDVFMTYVAIDNKDVLILLYTISVKDSLLKINLM